MQRPTDISAVQITGRVISTQFYPDQQKLVFTLKNQFGRFCIEFVSKDEAQVSKGSRVMVNGTLYSRKVQGFGDMPRISADRVEVIENGSR